MRGQLWPALEKQAFAAMVFMLRGLSEGTL